MGRAPFLIVPAVSAASGEATVYGQAVLADSPIGYWPLDELTGSTVEDAAGVNDGTVFGADLFVSGRPSSAAAASFDGTDDYISADPVTGFTDGLTLEALIYPTAVTGRMDIVNSASFNGSGYSLYLNSGVPSFRADLVGATNSFAAASTSLSAYQWYHVVGTWDKAGTGPVRLYVNGSEVSYDSQDASTADLRHRNDRWVIGARGSMSETPTGYFAGIIDEPAVYDYRLSAARVLDHAEKAGLA